MTSNATLNGVPNTVRPDLVGADPHHRLGRSVVRSGVVRGGQSLRQPRTQRRDRPGVPQHRSVGEQGAHDGERCRLQLRADVFDLFNHPNFGPPGNVVGSPTFGKISRTRLPTGEAGSSRQIQLVAKLSF